MGSACFPECHSPTVRLPESFRGGCSFGATRPGRSLPQGSPDFSSGATRADRWDGDYRARAQSQLKPPPKMWITGGLQRNLSAPLGAIVVELFGAQLKTDEDVEIVANIAGPQRYFLRQLFGGADAVAVALELEFGREHFFRQNFAIAVADGDVIAEFSLAGFVGWPADGFEKQLQIDTDLTNTRFHIGLARSIEPVDTGIEHDIGEIAPWSGPKRRQFGGIFDDDDVRAQRRGRR